MSTRETPDTAASPTEEIIMVSAMPTVMARVCSRIRGMISFFKSLLENIMVPVSFSPVFICSSPIRFASRSPRPQPEGLRRQLIHQYAGDDAVQHAEHDRHGPEQQCGHP